MIQHDYLFLRLGLTSGLMTQIETAIRSPPINSDVSKLKPIKEALPDDVSYSHIKLTIAAIKRKAQYKRPFSPGPSVGGTQKRAKLNL